MKKVDKKTIGFLLIAIAALFVLAGCQTNMAGKAYSTTSPTCYLSRYAYSFNTVGPNAGGCTAAYTHFATADEVRASCSAGKCHTDQFVGSSGVPATFASPGSGVYYFTSTTNGTNRFSVKCLNNVFTIQNAPTTSYVNAWCCSNAQTTTTANVPKATSNCTLITYSNWSACSLNRTQTRTVVSKSPAGCTGGITPVTTQNCVCAGPGMRADIYGGGQCCERLILQGSICNAQTTTTTAPTTTNITTTTTYHCIDSDGGKNYYVKGTTTKGIQNETDVCYKDTPTGAGDSSRINAMYEYFCDNSLGYDVFTQAYYVCPYGCSNGACINSTPCTDSDGGFNSTVKGNTKGTWGSAGGIVYQDGKTYPQGAYVNFTDYCYGNTSVNEFTCFNNSGKSQVTFGTINCPYGCKDGACVSVCSESSRCVNATTMLYTTKTCKQTQITCCGGHCLNGACVP